MKKKRTSQSLVILGLASCLLSMKRLDQVVFAEQMHTTKEMRNATAYVEVKRNLTEITLKNYFLTLHEQWKPEKHFVRAIGEDGNSLAIEDFLIRTSVDTSKYGVYPVEFVYKDTRQTVFAIVSIRIEEHFADAKRNNGDRRGSSRDEEQLPILLNASLFDKEILKAKNDFPHGFGQSHYSFENLAYHLSGTLLFGQRRYEYVGQIIQ